MVLSYKQIIINSYTEHNNQKTPYVSYFIREARIAKRDNFVEFTDFFNGCKVAITDYKGNIETQYNDRLTENDWALNAYYLALTRGEVTTPKGEPIQDHIDYIEKEKKFIERNGYKNNDWYACTTTDTGDIARERLDIKHKLYYSDIIQLESAVLQAEQEIMGKVTQSADAITLDKLFDKTSKYKKILEILVKQELICPGTYIWKDESKGNKGYLAALIKDLHGKQYFKGNMRPTSEQIRAICNNSFGWNIKISTIKHSKPDDFDFSFIPPASTTD